MDSGAYFERSRSWALDQRLETARSTRIAWIVAGCAVAVAIFEAIALAMLAPLKTVEPITLLVDRQTGYVQALNPAQPQRISADAALTQSFLAQYVVAREGFDRATVAVDYRKVAILSAGSARSGYLASMRTSNPAGPVQRYRGGTVVSVDIKSVVRLDANAALVRFNSRQTDATGRGSAPQPWISVVRYRYVDAPMALEDRLLNPLGFQVWSYRREAEAAPGAEQLASQADMITPTPIAAGANLESASPQRDVRPVPEVARRRTRDTAPVRSVRVKEVPVNQLPLGSPLTGPRQ